MEQAISYDGFVFLPQETFKEFLNSSNAQQIEPLVVIADELRLNCGQTIADILYLHLRDTKVFLKRSCVLLNQLRIIFRCCKY